MSKPLISVIVPIYGVEDFLCRCVDSILNQTYKNLEVILVDDGSPDRCPEICDEYAAKDKRVKIIHKKNGGLSSARNAGIDIATGEYLGFVDSDDYIHPEMYSILYNSLIKHNCKLSMCFHKKIKENQTITPNKTKNVYGYKIVNGKDIIRLYYNDKFTDMVCAWNKLYKRNLFDNIRYPEGKIMEDVNTTYKIFFACKNIIFINLELYYYTQRKNSIIYSSSMKAEYSIEALDNTALYCHKYIKDENNLHESLMVLNEWKANACLDAYYAAFRRGQKDEMERYAQMYSEYKDKMEKGGYKKRTMKLALFDLNPAVFRMAYHVRNKLLGVNDSKR